MRTACFVVQLIELKNPGAWKESRDGELRRSSGGAVEQGKGELIMIIQTGMRTDIPAFYHEWLINRIKEGFVMVRNPYDPTQVTRYSISPEVVDLMAFCTKNPAPMLPHMDVDRKSVV